MHSTPQPLAELNQALRKEKSTLKDSTLLWIVHLVLRGNSCEM